MFSLSDSVLQSPWVPGTTGLMDKDLVTRVNTTPCQEAMIFLAAKAEPKITTNQTTFDPAAWLGMPLLLLLFLPIYPTVTSTWRIGLRTWYSVPFWDGHPEEIPFLLPHQLFCLFFRDGGQAWSVGTPQSWVSGPTRLK